MGIAHVQLVHEQGQAGDKLRTRTWIEFQLLDENDQPIPGEKYELRLPGGTRKGGWLDDNGMVRIDDVPPGLCEISFPNLDKDAWTPVETKTEG